MVDCCNITAYFPTSFDNIISIDSKSGTDAIQIDDELYVGPTKGTASVSVYVSDSIYKGCAGQARVDIPWIQKYDCDNDVVHFIFKGAGRSSIIGEVDKNIVDLSNSNVLNSYRYIKASSSNSPISLYTDDMQYDGYGLKYTGDPWPFDSINEDTLVISNQGINTNSPPIWGDLYLHGFSISFNPGSLITATYSFVFTLASS